MLLILPIELILGLVITRKIIVQQIQQKENHPDFSEWFVALGLNCDTRDGCGTWERVKKSINVYGKIPHCFRHTFATRAHRAGVDDKTLQTIGGWKDLSTMKNIYIHTQDEDLKIARAILTSSKS